jgi:hypothetical protein
MRLCRYPLAFLACTQHKLSNSMNATGPIECPVGEKSHEMCEHRAYNINGQFVAPEKKEDGEPQVLKFTPLFYMTPLDSSILRRKLKTSQR